MSPCPVSLGSHLPWSSPVSPGSPLPADRVPVPAVAEAVARRLRGGVLERAGTSVAVLQSDTRDHYRTFQMLERLLHAPPRLLQQLLFQIPPSRQAMLVQRDWQGDWEALGGTGRGTGRDWEALGGTGSTGRGSGRGTHGCCPRRDYAAIVFFANSRFETGKRRLQFLSFGDFAACAQHMMLHWTQGALGEGTPWGQRGHLGTSWGHGDPPTIGDPPRGWGTWGVTACAWDVGGSG
uniref:Uncharacterized protein n=1 Tax=Strix occidentalis caurina TaxID=311401 RepID=A0A8D0FAC9_STROC